ncbi:MAG TPA: twin transmembrane helix small protein [Oceanospirillales bacterium]|nr:twin transmembrane helix small protein [Oceanospirillales bacterium]
MKILIVIILLFVIYNLALAMYYMIRDKGRGKNTVRFLTVRIAVSFALFIFILFALKMGWIQAHTILPKY